MSRRAIRMTVEQLEALTKRQIAKAIAPPVASEHTRQSNFASWAKLAEKTTLPELCVLFAVPNSGKRTKTAAAKLKREGMLAGVADMLLPLPTENCFGLAIEWKTEDGVQSKAQSAFEQNIQRFGRWRYEIVTDLDQAVALTTAHVLASRRYLFKLSTTVYSPPK